MTMTLQQMARMLIGLGYEEGAVFTALCAEFPTHTTEDVLTAVRVANGQVAQCEADLRVETAKQAALAFAAEHDLTKSMHPGGNA